MSGNNSDQCNPPCKLLVKDLSQCKSFATGYWKLDIPNMSNPTKRIPLTFNGLVRIQGTIEQTAGNDNEIIIVSDGTGKAKITQCSKIDGDRSWVEKGVYCTVLGVLVSEKGLPTITAYRLNPVNTNKKDANIKSLWLMEVEELKYLLTKQASPMLIKQSDY